MRDEQQQVASQEKRIQEGLDAIDRWLPSEKPDQAWFLSFVIEQKKQARKKLLRELTVFWMCACIVVFILLMTLMQAPMYFLVLQCILTFILLFTVRIVHKGGRLRRDR